MGVFTDETTPENVMMMPADDDVGSGEEPGAEAMEQPSPPGMMSRVRAHKEAV